MPRWNPIHWNPKSTSNLTRCGRRLADINHWDEDPARVTCKTCLSRIASDKKVKT